MRVMDKDIVPGLLELIENEFDSEVLNSEEIKGAIKQLKAKRATYKEANDFAVELGVILAGVLGRNITAETLPNGKMYFNIADRIIDPTMGKNYELIAGYAADVQTQLNYNAGLRIKGQKAELNQSRIDGIIERLSQEEDFNEIKWILDEPIKNFSQSIVDDTIKTNAEFHAKAGLRPKIIRRSTGDCCDWCEEIVGVYEYPDVPEDVYRRHRFCRCTVDYYPGDGKRQNVHTKAWIDPGKDAKIKVRKKIGLEEKPTPNSYVVQNAIKSKEVKDGINPEKQSKHLQGYSDGKSFIHGDLSTAKNLYNELKGTGEPILDRHGNWVNKERAIKSEVIGTHISHEGKSNNSRTAIIVYSKSGSHIYPGRDE